jgi:hypothetical protein
MLSAHVTKTSSHNPSLSLLTVRTVGAVVRVGITATAVVLLAVLVAITGSRLDEAAGRVRRTGGPVYLPQAQYLRPMSLGWQNVLADVLWFDTISYFGEHFRSDRTYPWLERMCDLITDLDPRAEHVYRFAGFILPWEADHTDAGIRLLEKGIRQFPHSWELHYYAGFDYYFFEDDYPRAIDHLRAAMQSPGVHQSVATLLAVLTAQGYGPDTAVAFLSDLERTVDSADMREIVRQNLADAQLRADVEQLNGALVLFRDRHGYAPIVIEDLAAEGLLARVPYDGMDAYVIDPIAARVRSATGRAVSELHESPVRRELRRGDAARSDEP